MIAPMPIVLRDGSQAVFIPKTHAEGRRDCCPLCDGAGLVRRLTIAHIVRVVCEHYSLDVDDLLSERRKRSVARPRQEAMYLARQLTSQSLPCIGRKFNRDHSTVIHAVRETEKRMAADLNYEQQVTELMMEAIS